MPAILDTPKLLEQRRADGDAQALVVGLVNNMPDAAIKTTERQFISLLDAASGHTPVVIQRLNLTDVPRSPTATAQFLRDYEDALALKLGQVDALIITGAEPRTPELEQEPYWQQLTQLIDWAELHTISSTFSCLAAHGAVLHLDGIRRRPLGTKLHGVFDCEATAVHPLVLNSPAVWRVPHSRFNDLHSDDLLAHGYHLLTHSTTAGVDMFIKKRKSLFLFMQGHLEYGSHSLLNEYLRDVRRFMSGETASYPEMPQGQFDEAAMLQFSKARERALENQGATDLLTQAASAAEKTLTNEWRAQAQNVYRNWLAYILDKKRLVSSLHQKLSERPQLNPHLARVQ